MTVGVVADSLSVPDLGLFLIKILAVVGAAVVGAIGVGLCLSLSAKWFLRSKVPRPILLVTRVLGGLIAGTLVWMWVFSIGGQGGLGGSGGGWWPFGQGGGPGAAPVEPTKTQPITTTAPSEPSEKRSPAVVIHILGGARVIDQRFYRIDQEAPRNWTELRQELIERKQRDPGLRELDIFIYNDSVDRDNPAVTTLEKWAKENGLTPKLSSPTRNAP